MKKTISLLLSLILAMAVLTALPFHALAAGGGPKTITFTGYGAQQVTVTAQGAHIEILLVAPDSGRYMIYSAANGSKDVVCEDLEEVLDNGTTNTVMQDAHNDYAGNNFAVFATLLEGRRYKLECYFNNPGDTGSFYVNVAKNPYQSIRYFPNGKKQFMEYTHGAYYDGDYYYFGSMDTWNDFFALGDRLEITYTNGKVEQWEVTSFGYFKDPVFTMVGNITNELPVSVWFDAPQGLEPWLVGTHNAIVRFAECRCEVPVEILATGWKKESDGKWRYYANSAYKTGWLKDGGKWYLLKYADGSMITGWCKSGGKWYYMNSSGAMVTGWQKISGKWYWFNSSGAMVTGWQKISGKWYYFNANGDMKTGWLKDGGKWYYLDSSGAMLANTSRKIGSKTYKFNSSGVCTNP